MDLSEIGYFSKTHGIKGQLILRTNSFFLEDEVQAIFIETPTGLAPYFVKHFSQNNTGFIIELEDIDTIEKAKLLIGKKVSISSNLIDAEEENDDDWVGYEIIDKNYGTLGTVFNVSNNGVQLLITIIYKQKEVILPLVEAFIDEIDDVEKKIFFNAPNGLIDLYLTQN